MVASTDIYMAITHLHSLVMTSFCTYAYVQNTQGHRYKRKIPYGNSLVHRSLPWLEGQLFGGRHAVGALWLQACKGSPAASAQHPPAYSAAAPSQIPAFL